MYAFLPTATKQTVDQVLDKIGVRKEMDGRSEKLSIEVKAEGSDEVVIIGSVKVARRKPRVPALVPKTLFYPVPKHVKRIQDMMKDFALGNHLLLIGNQGMWNNAPSSDVQVSAKTCLLITC